MCVSSIYCGKQFVPGIEGFRQQGVEWTRSLYYLFSGVQGRPRLTGTRCRQGLPETVTVSKGVDPVVAHVGLLR